MSNATVFGRAYAAALLAAAAPGAAQPSEPVYLFTFADCTTGDNAFWAPEGRHWDVDPGCDLYQIDVYERPTAQTYQTVLGRYAAEEYFGYVDIEAASVGWDGQYLFVRIDLYNRFNSTSGGDDIEVGMMERYGFRFSNDPDGRFGVLIVSDQPEVKNEPNTEYGNIGVSGHRDTNGDVGGASDGPTGLEVTKSDNPDEEDGMNGYDEAFIQDGTLEGGPQVAWVRLRPGDDTVVELALDYKALGYTTEEIESLAYFDVEAIKGGPKDPQSYLWNDKYTKQEAGSPNPGKDGESEFGTEGLENIYEADTVRAVFAGGVCAPDMNEDGDLNLFDFLSFVGLFNAGDQKADFDGNGDLNVFDFFAFNNGFNEGC